MKIPGKVFFFVLCMAILPQAYAAEPVAPTLTPDQALQKLLEGNQRFVEKKALHPEQDGKRREEVSHGQKPFAAILSCSDSRVPPELIFDQGLGDLFVVRVAGNTLNAEGLGSFEYGVEVLGARLIVVLGHSNCGAVEAALKGKPLPGHIGSVTAPIDPAIQEGSCTMDKAPLACAIHANVDHVVDQLRRSEPIIAPRVKSGALKIVGGEYDLATGMVKLGP